MMEFSVSSAENGDYVVIRVVGEFTRDSAAEFIRAGIESGAKSQPGRYLVDVNDARNVDKALGNVRLHREVVPEVDRRFRSARVAVLASPGDRSHDFFVAFAQSEGFEISLFTDRAEAVAYLAGEGSILGREI